MGGSNKKKGKQSKPRPQSAPANAAAGPPPAGTPREPAAPSPPGEIDGRYARYKRSTAVVQQWCDSSIGKVSGTLTEWAEAMDTLAQRQEQMPRTIKNDLDKAITLRDDAAMFYKSIQADDDSQRRHWHVCKLLRHFRRLFTPREKKVEPKDAAAPAGDAAAESLNKGFAALDVDEASAQQEPDEDIAWAKLPPLPAAADKIDADELPFALACLMADAARARAEVRAIWDSWTPAKDDHGAGVLGASAAASFAVIKLQTIVNATQLLLGLPDANLATLSVAAARPRVRLAGLRGARPELNGRCGWAGGRDKKGRYTVTLDRLKGEEESELVKVRSVHLHGEHGWGGGGGGGGGAETMLGCMQHVGRVLAAFGEQPLVVDTGEVPLTGDHAEVLEALVTKGVVHRWLLYGRGTGELGSYGAGDTLWRQQLRSFQQSRYAASFVFTFLVLCALDATTLLAAKRGRVHAAELLYQVTDELKEYVNSDWRAVGALQQVLECGPSPPPTGLLSKATAVEVFAPLLGQRAALEVLVTNDIVHATIFSCPWLAGDALQLGGKLKYEATGLFLFLFKGDVTTGVHLYHALRRRGALKPIAEIDAYVRMYRRGVFFRTGLPERGAFVSSLMVQLGMSAAAAVGGRVDASNARDEGIDRSRARELTGRETTEFSLLSYVSHWAGAGLDVDGLDLRAAAYDEVATLHRAPVLSGAAKLVHLAAEMTRDEAARGAAAFLLKEVDEAKRDAWPAVAAKAVRPFERLFEGCSRLPPADEAAVPLAFSAHTQVAPEAEHLSSMSSSYTPAEERLTREELKAKLRQSRAEMRGAMR